MKKNLFLNFAIGHILRTKNTVDDKVVGGAQNMPCVIVYVRFNSIKRFKTLFKREKDK